MNSFDLIENTLAWVYGQCILWNQIAKQFPSTDSREFIDFVNRTHNIVYKYIRGRQILDGTCSDMECNLALKASHIFTYTE